MIRDCISVLYVMIGVILYCIISIAHNFIDGVSR